MLSPAEEGGNHSSDSHPQMSQLPTNFSLIFQQRELASIKRRVALLEEELARLEGLFSK